MWLEGLWLGRREGKKVRRSEGRKQGVQKVRKLQGWKARMPICHKAGRLSGFMSL